jgi:hypothetical protein
VLHEWVRYHNHKKNKAYYKECIEIKHRARVIGEVTKRWKGKCRGVIVAKRIQKAVNRQMEEAMD